MERIDLNEKLSKKILFKKGEFYSSREISQIIKPTAKEIRRGILKITLRNHPDWQYAGGRTYKYIGASQSALYDQIQLPLPLEQKENLKDDYKRKNITQKKYFEMLISVKEKIDNNNEKSIDKLIQRYNVSKTWSVFLKRKNIIYYENEFIKWNENIPVSMKLVHEFIKYVRIVNLNSRTKLLNIKQNSSSPVEILQKKTRKRSAVIESPNQYRTFNLFWGLLKFNY